MGKDLLITSIIRDTSQIEEWSGEFERKMKNKLKDRIRDAWFLRKESYISFNIPPKFFLS
jgi:hypothetical protein